MEFLKNLFRLAVWGFVLYLLIRASLAVLF